MTGTAIIFSNSAGVALTAVGSKIVVGAVGVALCVTRSVILSSFAGEALAVVCGKIVVGAVVASIGSIRLLNGEPALVVVGLTALGEVGLSGGIAAHHLTKVIDVLDAGAKVWVVLFGKINQHLLLTELSGGVVSGLNQEVYVDEARLEGALDGVETLLFVHRHVVGHSDHQLGDDEGTCVDHLLNNLLGLHVSLTSLSVSENPVLGGACVGNSFTTLEIHMKNYL